MSTIAFVPYPETGHFNPSFKLAKRLQAEGHRVVYLGLPDFADSTCRQGLEFASFFESVFPKGFIRAQSLRETPASAHENGREARHFDTQLMEAMRDGTCNPLTEISQAAQSIKADLMLVDLLLPDFALIASQMGLRVAFLNAQLYNPWDGINPAYLSPGLWELPELVLCPEALDFTCVERKKPCYYVEPSIDLERRDVPFPWERIDADKPLVYCSFGSQGHLIKGSTEFLHRAIEAATIRPDLQFVLSTGGHLNPEDLPAPPANAVLVSMVPQLELLEHTSLMITHGGFNSVKEAIYFSVPMLVFPTIRDHPAVAARVVYHGLGLRGNVEGATAADICSLIARIEGDPSFKKRLNAMSNIFREVEESGIGAEIVRSILAGRAPSLEGGHGLTPSGFRNPEPEIFYR